MKEIKDLAWAQEAIIERFDQSIINAMTPGSLIFGGTVRDIAAGMPLVGDLDIVVPKDEANAMMKALNESPKWSKINKNKGAYNPKGLKKKRPGSMHMPSVSPVRAPATRRWLRLEEDEQVTERPDPLVVGEAVYPRNAENTEAMPETPPAEDTPVNVTIETVEVVPNMGMATNVNINVATNPADDEPDQPADMPTPEEAPNIMETTVEPGGLTEEEDAIVNNDDMPEGTGIAVSNEPASSWAREIFEDAHQRRFTFDPGNTNMPPWITANKKKSNPYKNSNLNISDVTTFESVNGARAQIILTTGGTSPLHADQRINESISIAKKVDIICCGLVMNRDGKVFEVVKGAYNDCKDRVLNFNKSTMKAIEIANIENLARRVVKLENRGWKSNINVKDIANKQKKILKMIKQRKAKEKAEKAKLAHQKEMSRKKKQEKRLAAIMTKRHRLGVW